MIDIANELLLGKAREGFEGRGVYLMPKCVYELGGGSGPSYIDEIVSGVSPLALLSAKENGLNYLKLFGGTEQRNIPEQYTQVNYVTNTAQTQIDTGLVINRSKNYVFEYRGRAVTGSWYILQARESASAVVMGLSGSNSSGNFILSWTGGTASTTNVLRSAQNIDHIYYVRGEVDAVNGTLSLYVKDETSNTEQTVTGVCTAGQGLYPTNIGLLGNLTVATTPQLVGINNDVYMARIKENGVTIMDYVPARQGATAGFYDTISGTFKTSVTPENLVADGNTVPTPDAPMDIWCNNGVLKARHKSGLPLGYTQVEYLESFGAQYIDTGRVPNNTDIIDQKFQVKQLSNTTTAWYGSMPSSSVITPRIGIGTYVLNGVTKFFVGANATNDVFPGAADTNPHTVWWHVINTNTIEVSTDGSEPRLAGYSTGGFLVPAVELTSYLFARHGTDGVQVYDGNGTKIYYHKEYLADGTLVLDMVPVKRNSDNELGMYDFVSGQFFTNQGTGSFSAGDPVSDPVEIYADGLVETIGVSQLPAAYRELEYITATGTQYIDTGVKLNSSSRVEISFKSENTSITQALFGCRDSASGTRNAFAIWENVGSRMRFDYQSEGLGANANISTTDWNLTIKDGVSNMLNGVSQPTNTSNTFSGSYNAYIFSINTGGTAGPNTDGSIAYCKIWQDGTTLSFDGVPCARRSDGVVGMYDKVSGTFFTNAGTGNFVAGDIKSGTATCENLLSVGKYTDVQEILSGNITRKVGIKVLDGTEIWNYYSVTQGDLFRTQIADSVSDAKNSSGVLCNAYRVTGNADRTSGTLTGSATNYDFINDNYTTLDTWKTYLTNQYNAGTPVIIIYPLATETTESVTAQTLTTVEGDNTLEITQASISGLTMEASYKKKV